MDFGKDFVMFIKPVVLLVVAFFPSCIAFSTHVPITVCEAMHPHHENNISKPLNTSPYTITVSSDSYTTGALLKVTIAGSRLFKGFLVQARREGVSGPPYPIGSFKGPVPAKTTAIWCSGGEPKNTVSHKHPSRVNFTSVTVTWQAPPLAAGNISFYLTIVQQFDTFWVKQKSSIITGPLAAVPTNTILEGDFQITKSGCGVTKGCYSEPPSCKGSEDCSYLVTYKDNGDNITFELSTSLGYASVGFNPKQEMNNTDAIMCSKLASNVVKVKQYYLDYHQPIRYDLRSSSDIKYLQGVYNNGIVKCRFTRKKVPQAPRMRNLATQNWYFIFAWSHVSSTGVMMYHYGNASFTPTVVDITKPLNLTNGRKAKPAPTSSPDDKITKTDCGKTKGCYSEPSDCETSEDCKYLVTYKSDKQRVMFEMSANMGWVAVGFNHKKAMDGTDAIICSREASGERVQISHYNIKDYNPPTKNVQGTSRLKDGAGKYINGVVQCKVSRLLTEPGMIDLSKEIFLIFARGPASGGNLEKHSDKSVTVKKVDVSSTEALKAGQKNFLLIRAHAILMSIAWLVLASLGMFVARYMKPVWGDLFGKKAWFQVHRFLMVSTLVFTVTAVILAFVYAEGWTKADDAHPIIGITVLVLAVVQPIMAAFRPAPGDDSRVLFNWAHRCVGLSALTLAVINCFLGVLLPHFGVQTTGLYPLIVYCIGVFLVLVFEVILMIRVRKSYDLDQQPKAAMKDGKVEVETKTPAKPVEHNKRLKKLMFGFLIIVVSGCCLAMLILLARSGG